MKNIFNPFTGSLTPVLNKAAEIKYLNTTSGLTAEELQSAVDELAQMIADLPNPIVYKGTWDASTNTPTLSNSDTGVEGFLYQVQVAGTVDFGSGPISFEIGDKVVNNGTNWEKWDLTDAVLSVNGETGIVSLTTTEIPEGTNLYFTDSRARTAAVVDSMAGSETDQAPSVSSVASYTDTNFLKRDGSNTVTGFILPNAPASQQFGSSAIPFQAMVAGTFEVNTGNVYYGSMYYEPGTLAIDAAGQLKLYSTTSINVTNSRIINLADGTNPNDAVNKGQLDTAVGSIDLSAYLKHDGTVPMTGTLDLNGNNITNVNTLNSPGLANLTINSDNLLTLNSTETYINSPYGTISLNIDGANIVSNTSLVNINNGSSVITLNNDTTTISAGTNGSLNILTTSTDLNSATDLNINCANNMVINSVSAGYINLNSSSFDISSVTDLTLSATNRLHIKNEIVHHAEATPEDAPIANLYKKAVILSGNTETVFSYDASLYGSAIVRYNILQATTGESRVGELKVAFNPVTQALSVVESSTETADVGTIFNVSYSTGFITVEADATSSANNVKVNVDVTLFVLQAF